MKVFSFEVGAVVLFCLMCYFVHKQSKKITKMEETIELQRDAIEKQRVVIYLQHHQIQNPGNNIFKKYQ
jgi:hypothetical protein